MKLGLVVLPFVVTLAACPPAYWVADDNDPVIAPEAPPEDLDEVPPPAPWPGAVWTPGYWYWTGEGYSWVGGQWSRPPATGFVWVNPGWIFMHSVFRFMPGRWAHPQRVPHWPYYRAPHHGPGPRPHH